MIKDRWRLQTDFRATPSLSYPFLCAAQAARLVMQRWTPSNKKQRVHAPMTISGWEQKTPSWFGSAKRRWSVVCCPRLGKNTHGKHGEGLKYHVVSDVVLLTAVWLDAGHREQSCLIKQRRRIALLCCKIKDDMVLSVS